MFRTSLLILFLLVNSSLVSAQQYSQEIIDYLKNHKESEQLLIEQFEKLNSKIDTLDTRIDKIETKIEKDNSLSLPTKKDEEINKEENNIILAVSKNNNINDFIDLKQFSLWLPL